MPTRSFAFDLPNDGKVIVEAVRDGFPGGWAWICKRIGIDPTFPPKWCDDDEEQRRIMPVEVLSQAAAHLLKRWPNRGADIAEALVGHVVTACGCRIVPLSEDAPGEEVFDEAADAGARVADWHRAARHPKSDGGTAITEGEIRAGKPVLIEASRDIEPAIARAQGVRS
jgi:hypothetical protein